MPIFSAIAGALGGLGSLFSGFIGFLKGGTILAGIAKMGLGLAAQYAVGRLLGPKSQAQATRLETTYGENLAREVVLGRVGTAGHHVYRNAFAKGNHAIQDVRILSHFRISGVPRVRYNGAWMTPSGGLVRPDGLINVAYALGSMDQAANASLVTNANPAGRWTADHRLAGIAYAVCYSALSQKQNNPQPWDAFFEVEGPTLYDWRSDSSVGGDGDDRWNDQDSWSGRFDNPVLQMYALERGIRNGTELMVGKGSVAARLPLAEWTLAANICDEVVGGKPRYSAGIIASSGAGVTHEQNMSPLLEACAASWVDDASGQYPIVGANQSVVATITDADIMVDEPFRFSVKRSRSELINTAAGSYIAPEKFYQSAPLTLRQLDDAVTEDGERLATSIPYSAVTDAAQADRLIDIALRASRYQANAEICVRPKFKAVKPGRWIRWNSAEHGDRKFLIVSKRLGPFSSTTGARNVYLTLQEVGDGIFDPTEYETVPPTTLPGGAGDFQASLDGYAVGPVIISVASGAQRAAIRPNWWTITDLTISSVDFEYRPKVDPTSVATATAAMDQTAVLLTSVVPNSIYEVRYRLVAPLREIAWTNWVEVLTPDIKLGAVDIYPIDVSQLNAGLYKTLQNVHRRMDDLRNIVELHALATADAAGVAAEEHGVFKRNRNATAGAIFQLNAAINDPVTGLVAIAEALIAVNASVGLISADGLFQLRAEAGSGDVVSRMVAEVRATIGDVWVAAGWMLETGFVGGDPGQSFSNYVVTATKTIFRSGDGTQDAEVVLFDGDGAYLENARIGTVIFDQLSSANGKLVIRGSGTLADISVLA